MSDALAFGQDLRRARERRGLSLEQMAEQTKISASLFAGLERGDLSRWPSGIFRRAFVRSYAETVGLPAEETVVRFLSAHPEEAGESPSPAADPARLPAVGAPHLTLVTREESSPQEDRHLPRLPRRFALPIVDVLGALVPATIVGHVAGWNWFWPTAACTGFGGHLLFSWLNAGTPGALLLPAGHAADAARTATPVGEARLGPKAEAQEAAPGPMAAAAPHRRRQLRHGGGPRPVATRQRRIPH